MKSIRKTYYKLTEWDTHKELKEAFWQTYMTMGDFDSLGDEECLFASLESALEFGAKVMQAYIDSAKAPQRRGFSKEDDLGAANAEVDAFRGPLRLAGNNAYMWNGEGSVHIADMEITAIRPVLVRREVDWVKQTDIVVEGVEYSRRDNMTAVSSWYTATPHSEAIGVEEVILTIFIEGEAS